MNLKKIDLNNKVKLGIIASVLFLLTPNQEVYADMKNEAIISFAEGDYVHKEKGFQSSDAILIQHAGKNILIDSGAKGEKLKEFLQLKEVKEIDYLIITHLHGDHIGGIKNLINTSYILNSNSSKKATINNIKIKNVIIQKPIEGKYLHANDRDSRGNDKYTPIYNNLVSDLKSKGITVLNPEKASNQKITLDKETSIVIKNTDFFKANSKNYKPVKVGTIPTAAQDKSLMKLNSQSLVLEFKHVNDTFLLTGDITNEASDSLISRGLLGKYDVLKVPHHGYGGSSNFNLLNTTEPDFAVVTARGISNSNIMAKFKYNKIPVYGTKNTHHIVIKSKGNNISTSNIYTQKPNSKTLVKATNSSNLTHNLNNAYLRKDGVNYYYLSKSSSINQLVEVDFSTAKGFNTTDKTKPIYPTSGKGYICVKNNKFQYGWQKIKVNGKENYYYFDESTGLAKKSGVYKLKRELDSNGNPIAVTENTKENYYYLGSKGECLTGFQDATINGVKGRYYFKKGDVTPANRGKLMTSKNGSFLETKDYKYWIEKDGRLSTKTGLYNLKDSEGKENSYYLKDGVVQTGFIKINGKEYYFKKGDVTPANKGKLMTTKNGDFLFSKDGKKAYFINADGSKNTKSSIKYNGVTYKFNSDGTCKNPPKK